jgi:hypothetical protein
VLMNPLTDRATFDQAAADKVAPYWPFILVGGIVSVVFGALILSIDWSVDSLATFIALLLMIQACRLH